jgi:hypothetical protein
MLAEAMPTATDFRFKSGSFVLIACWLTILFSLYHSVQHYMPRHRGLLNQIVGFARSLPVRFKLLLFFSASLIAYQILISFIFEYSLLNIKGSLIAIFLGGYCPAMFILLIQGFYGLASPNEDLELIRQRRERGVEHDQELGIVKKPSWWSRINRSAPSEAETQANQSDRTGSSTGQATNATTNRPPTQPDDGVPTRPAVAAPYVGRSDRRRSERAVQAFAGLLFPNNVSTTPSMEARRAELMQDGPPPPYSEQRASANLNAGIPPGARRPVENERSNSTATSTSTAPPQQVRSMLDV